MGLRTKSRTHLDVPDVYGVEVVSTSSTRPEPINDVDTDEARVILRLGNLATTGDFGYDDSRQWGELLPTIPTLIGALHLLPEVLEGKTPEERERLAELFDAKFEGQFGEHDRNLFARVLELNKGMSRAYGLLVDSRRLRTEADALHHQNEELVKERGIAYRSTDEWDERFRQARELEQERLEVLNRLNYNPDFTPTAKKTRAVLREWEVASETLRSAVSDHIEGRRSHDEVRVAAQDWLINFEELKRRVREPNPKRKDGASTEDTTEEVYDDDL